MIRSFRHRGLKRLYERDDRRGIPAKMVPKLRVILADLDAADHVSDLVDRRGYATHPLKGDLKGCWALKVTGNWRVTFRFDDEPWDVDLIDYH